MPIDWDNYNDVYNVFWNYFSDNCKGSGHLGEIIKIYGKIDPNSFHFSQDSDTSRFSFVLMTEHKYEDNDIYEYLNNRFNISGPSMVVLGSLATAELLEMLTLVNLIKRIYIKGKVRTDPLTGDPVGMLHRDPCCFAFPHIIFYSIDDIYFETNKNE
jgi:hypothetical protein